MRRALAVLAATALLAACTDRPSTSDPRSEGVTSPTPTATAAPGMRVAVVLPPADSAPPRERAQARREIEEEADTLEGVTEVRTVQAADATFVRDLLGLLARDDYDLVCAFGAGAGAAVAAVAPTYPRTSFCATAATPSAPAPNVIVVDVRVEEGAYLSGLAAGWLPRSGRATSAVSVARIAATRQDRGFLEGLTDAGDRRAPLLLQAEVGRPAALVRRARSVGRSLHLDADGVDPHLFRHARRSGLAVTGRVETLPTSAVDSRAVLVLTDLRFGGILRAAIDAALARELGSVRSLGASDGVLEVILGEHPAIPGMRVRLQRAIAALEDGRLIVMPPPPRPSPSPAPPASPQPSPATDS